jgi:hypothetical protein
MKPSGKSVRHHLERNIANAKAKMYRRRLGEESPEEELRRDLEKEPWYQKASPGQKRTVRYILQQAFRTHYQNGE